MADKSLKPCPLCGCRDITIHCPSSHGLTLYGVACDGCGLRIKRFDKLEAVAAWNRRVSVPGSSGDRHTEDKNYVNS
ncbi:Lar family restriction alleviation protein [Morganella morganii]|nr:Lar family restriction alleviation protein [Morganella morganii]EKU4304197.1 Lar family restriction alleviation protein [Morganella morganii]